MNTKDASACSSARLISGVALGLFAALACSDDKGKPGQDAAATVDIGPGQSETGAVSDLPSSTSDGSASETDPPSCGNGRLDPGEQCDDSNTASGDGCSSRCQLEDWPPCPMGPCAVTLCGDGRVSADEVCDDGNVEAGDGCSADCHTVEPGWRCRAPGRRCSPICGDRMIKGTETCDDGNGVEGDGCSAQCLDEPGWDCSSGVCVLSPSFDGGIDVGERTYLRCGDGIVSGAEECDDGETNDGNAYGACASTCTYAAYCGDGIVNGPEECDLGERNGAVTYGVGGCTRTCAKSHFCGDGIIDAAYGEECDLGVLNGLAVDAGIGCTSDCRVWPIGPP